MGKGFIRQLNEQEREKEILRIKNFIEIGLYVITAIQIYQEFFNNRYLDYVVILITMVESGLFIYGCMSMVRRLFYKSVSKKRCSLFTEFHNTFYTSMIIPVIFLFTESNTSFVNTRIPDVEILKKICVLIMLAVMGFYRLLPIMAKKYEAKISDWESEENYLLGRRYIEHISYYLFFLVILDVIALGAMYMLFMGMILHNEAMAAAIFAFTVLICANIILEHRIIDKKRILRTSLCVFTALYIAVTIYNVYLEESVTVYSIPSGDYHCKIAHKVSGEVDLYCSFEENDGEKLMKYSITYTNDEGEMLYSGVYECVYEAILPSKGITRWYDIAGNVYINRKDIHDNENPVVIEVVKEDIKMNENYPYKEFIDNELFTFIGENGREREILIFGDNYIKIRGETLEKAGD